MAGSNAFNLLKQAAQKADEIPRVVLQKEQVLQAPANKAKPLIGPAFYPKDKMDKVTGWQSTILKREASANMPSVNLTKPQLGRTTKQLPDLGKSFIDAYNPLEKVVQEVEDANQFLQNLQSGLAFGTVSPNKSISSISNKGLNKFAPVFKGSDYADIGLQVVDAGRALLDPEYRDQADKGYDRLLDSGLEGADLFVQALQYANQRPVGFAAAAMREYQDIGEKQKMYEDKIAQSDIDEAKQKEKYKSRVLPKGYKADDAKITNPNNNKLDPSKNDKLLLELAKKAFAKDAFYPQQNRQNYL